MFLNFSRFCESRNLRAPSNELFVTCRCYCRALSLSPDNSLIWHDLAHIYNLQANYMSEPDVKKQLREHALAAIKKCILLYSKEWQHWNLLGVIAASAGM